MTMTEQKVTIRDLRDLYDCISEQQDEIHKLRTEVSRLVNKVEMLEERLDRAKFY